jgi:hypothetical protein
MYIFILSFMYIYFYFVDQSQNENILFSHNKSNHRKRRNVRAAVLAKFD